MLANGLRYFVRRHQQPRRRATLMLAVPAGSALEDEDQRGVALESLPAAITARVMPPSPRWARVARRTIRHRSGVRVLALRRALSVLDVIASSGTSVWVVLLGIGWIRLEGVVPSGPYSQVKLAAFAVEEAETAELTPRELAAVAVAMLALGHRG